jgi:hypothetical protein
MERLAAFLGPQARQACACVAPPDPVQNFVPIIRTRDVETKVAASLVFHACRGEARCWQRDRASLSSAGAGGLEHALFPCPVQLPLECPWIDGFLFPCGAIGRAMNTTIKEQLAQLSETQLVILGSRVSNLL